MHRFRGSHRPPSLGLALAPRLYKSQVAGRFEGPVPSRLSGCLLPALYRRPSLTRWGTALKEVVMPRIHILGATTSLAVTGK